MSRLRLSPSHLMHHIRVILTSYPCHDITEILLLWSKTRTKKQTFSKLLLILLLTNCLVFPHYLICSPFLIPTSCSFAVSLSPSPLLVLCTPHDKLLLQGLTPGAVPQWVERSPRVWEIGSSLQVNPVT